jgi:sulfur-oxidizing protein SoxY
MLKAAAVAAALWLGAAAARAEEADADRAARWHDLAAHIFGARPIADGTGMLTLDLPPRALDAALVPLTVTFTGPQRPAALYLTIDDNPAPLVGTFHFGPAADVQVLKTRVRVDQYTLVHAVAEMPDGRLYAVARFIKAAGGCSAPGGGSEQEALARIGRMKLLPRGAAPDGQRREAELLISHPQFNGMQMNQVTRLYIPARYIQSVTVTEGGALVFRLDSDISLSENPAITFGYRPKPGAALDVEVHDTAHAVFRNSFPADAAPS